MKATNKFLSLLFAFMTLSVGLSAQNTITFTWQTEAANQKSFQILATPGATFTVNWGDGSAAITATGASTFLTPQRTYAAAGSYTVTITAAANCELTHLILDGGRLRALNVSGAASLKHLGCYNNNYAIAGSSIILNTALVSLLLHNNGLVALPDISACTNLEVLWCNHNALTALPNLNAHTALKDLRCHDNLLTALPSLNANTALEQLWCSNNNLSSLSLANNTALRYLYGYNNALSNLNLSANTALQHLYCYNNNLTGLNLTTNTGLGMVFCYNNQLLLSDLYAADLILRSNTGVGRLGPHELPQQTATQNVPFTFTPAQHVFNSVYTAFSVEQGGTPVAPGVTTYSVTNGVITFHAAGTYLAKMSNSAILSDPGFPAEDIIPFLVPMSGTSCTITISASDNDVCADTGVTYTAYIANAGASPTYQWLINGAAPAAGGTGLTYTYTPANGDIVTCVLTSTDPACPNPITSNAITMVVRPKVTPSLTISIVSD